MYKRLFLPIFCYLAINIPMILKSHIEFEQQKWEHVEKLFIINPVEHANNSVFNKKLGIISLGSFVCFSQLINYKHKYTAFSKNSSPLSTNIKEIVITNSDLCLYELPRTHNFTTFCATIFGLFAISIYEKKYLRNHFLYQKFLEFIKNWPIQKELVPEYFIESFDELYEEYQKYGETKQFKQKALVLLKKIQTSIYHKFSYKYYQASLFKFSLFF
ncbi:MAG: hypothetical protein WDZ41_05545 [Candidatus Babeliales bacterium]